MAVTFRQLKYFLILAEELHFGRAAKRLHISQPPLSASLKQLEEELGARLLERSSKHVALTRAGEVFRRQAQRLLSQLGDTQELVRRVAESASGLVRVGFTPTMIFRRLPLVLGTFRDRHPAMDIQLLELNSAEQVEALGTGRIDIGFIHAMPLPDGITSLTIANEPFVCCLPSHHPLAGRSRMRLQELAGEPLIMFNRQLASHYYDRIIGLFRLAGVEPDIRHEVNHWLTITALVAGGMGASLVPRALAESGFAGVSFVPLESSDAWHAACCIWVAEQEDAGRDLFVDCVRETFEAG